MKTAQPYGVVYVAFGAPYLAMALVSASTLRKTNPGMPFCIVSNIEFNPGDFDFWDTAIDHQVALSLETGENRLIKTAAIDFSPFEKTIYLDCDTFINGDLSDGLIFLDYFDIAFKGETDSPDCNVPIIGGRPSKQLPHWNGGVFLFDKSAASRDFFKKWKDAYIDFNVEYDEISMVKALFTTSARLLSLDGRWNYMSFYSLRSPKLNRNAKVVHYTSRISFSVEKMILEVCRKITSVPDAEKQVLSFIKKKRRHRRNKIGTLKYCKLKLKWLVYP